MRMFALGGRRRRQTQTAGRRLLLRFTSESSLSPLAGAAAPRIAPIPASAASLHGGPVLRALQRRHQRSCPPLAARPFYSGPAAAAAAAAWRNASTGRLTMCTKSAGGEGKDAPAEGKAEGEAGESVSEEEPKANNSGYYSTSGYSAAAYDSYRRLEGDFSKLYTNLQHQELTLYERIMEASWNRFLLVSGMVVLGVMIVAINWEDIRRYFSGEISEVASTALGDQKLLMKSNELAVAVAHHLIYDQMTQEALTGLVAEVLQNKKTRDELVDLFSKLFQDPVILDEVAKLSTEVTHRVLQDEEVNRHAQDVTGNLFNKVLAEKALQNQAGVALWNSIKYAIVPNWFGEYKTQKPGETESEPRSKKGEPSSRPAEPVAQSDPGAADEDSAQPDDAAIEAEPSKPDPKPEPGPEMRNEGDRESASEAPPDALASGDQPESQISRQQDGSSEDAGDTVALTREAPANDSSAGPSEKTDDDAKAVLEPEVVADEQEAEKKNESTSIETFDQEEAEKKAELLLESQAQEEAQNSFSS